MLHAFAGVDESRTVVLLRAQRCSEAMSTDAITHPFQPSTVRLFASVICLLACSIPTLQSLHCQRCICSMSELWTLPLSRCKHDDNFLKNSFSFIWRIGMHRDIGRSHRMHLNLKLPVVVLDTAVPPVTSTIFFSSIFPFKLWKSHENEAHTYTLIVLRNLTATMHTILDESLQNNKLSHNSMHSEPNKLRFSFCFVAFSNFSTQNKWHMKLFHD